MYPRKCHFRRGCVQQCHTQLRCASTNICTQHKNLTQGTSFPRRDSAELFNSFLVQSKHKDKNKEKRQKQIAQLEANYNENNSIIKPKKVGTAPRLKKQGEAVAVESPDGPQRLRGRGGKCMLAGCMHPNLTLNQVRKHWRHFRPATQILEQIMHWKAIIHDIFLIFIFEKGLEPELERQILSSKRKEVNGK